jgi:superfamily II DNA or RNA helicase
MELEIGCNIILRNLKPETENAVMGRLTMPNPKYDEAVKMDRWTGDINPYLFFYQETDQGLVCPRGAARQICTIAKQHGEKIRLIDNRRTLPPVDFQFRGSLRPFQQQAVNSCLKHEFGVLSAPTGAGKTVMAAYMIAQRKQPELIVVHTKELLKQWQDRIKQFLGINAGVIGGGKMDIQPVTVATVQSLVKVAGAVAPHFGYLICDECHRAPAMQYVDAIKHFDCRYMTGLSATTYRRDGLSKVIFWHLGDVAGSIDKAEVVDNGDLCQAQVVWIETDFNTTTDASTYYTKVLSDLAEDQSRNKLICRTVAENNGHGISLLLSDRKAHCHTLAAILKAEHGINAHVLTGATSTRDREQILSDLQQGKCKYMIATSALVGEGFDMPAISSMFLTTPVRYHGRLIQYIGRALRPAPGKDQATVFDFVDNNNPVFASQARYRRQTYMRQQITDHCLAST